MVNTNFCRCVFRTYHLSVSAVMLLSLHPNYCDDENQQYMCSSFPSLLWEESIWYFLSSARHQLSICRHPLICELFNVATVSSVSPHALCVLSLPSCVLLDACFFSAHTYSLILSLSVTHTHTATCSFTSYFSVWFQILPATLC